MVNSSRGGGAKDTWIIAESETWPGPTDGFEGDEMRRERRQGRA